MLSHSHNQPRLGRTSRLVALQALRLKLALVIFLPTGNDFVGFGSEAALSPEPAERE